MYMTDSLHNLLSDLFLMSFGDMPESLKSLYLQHDVHLQKVRYVLLFGYTWYNKASQRLKELLSNKLGV